jgi:hypothetical protein
MILGSPAEHEIWATNEPCPHPDLPPRRGKEGRPPSPPPRGRTKEGASAVPYSTAPPIFSEELSTEILLNDVTNRECPFARDHCPFHGFSSFLKARFARLTLPRGHHSMFFYT